MGYGSFNSFEAMLTPHQPAALAPPPPRSCAPAFRPARGTDSAEFLGTTSRHSRELTGNGVTKVPNKWASNKQQPLLLRMHLKPGCSLHGDLQQGVPFWGAFACRVLICDACTEHGRKISAPLDVQFSSR